ncbi:hypothetical protein D8674_038536 [Pyrus ussuriensis x Pyrus communis]|uniref:CCHC-type domain-containing protein n=1 Tax=Pyrus ussuriensis x Pyrus communis TaxID=2448454 RepID=A0A5N5FC26_9ROSA|nr:hypothetical protein D8674_038536 [Pyrus ussuriensis x Pyrus communis]
MGSLANFGSRSQFIPKPNYKGHNSFKQNAGFKGKGYNTDSSGGFSSTNTRQFGTNMWNGNTENRSPTVIECQICNKRGHTVANCFHRNTNPPSNGFHMLCQICGRHGHSALDCYHRGNYAFQGQQPPAQFTAMTAQQTDPQIPQDAWIVDTGASHHITADINALNSVTPFQGSETILVGNGTGLSIANTGATTIKNNSHSLVLKNVLHVPKIARSLLSVQQLCADNRSWFVCDENEFFVQDKKTRDILYRGKSKARQLFQIPVIKQSRGVQSVIQQPYGFLGQLVKSTLWHQRFGHPSNKIMSIMLKQSNIPLELDMNHSMCTYCLQGKMCRLPFSSSSDRYFSPFEKVHSDVWGPSPVKTVEGYRYYVTFVDQYTNLVLPLNVCNLMVGVNTQVILLKLFLLQRVLNK